MAATNQHGSIPKMFSMKLQLEAVRTRDPDLVTLDAVSSQTALQCVGACFEPPGLCFPKETGVQIDLRCNVHKRRGTWFDLSVEKSRTEGVRDATNGDSSTSSLQSHLQDVQYIMLPSFHITEVTEEMREDHRPAELQNNEH
jgi:hypothetical protein